MLAPGLNPRRTTLRPFSICHRFFWWKLAPGYSPSKARSLPPARLQRAGKNTQLISSSCPPPAPQSSCLSSTGKASSVEHMNMNLD